MSGRDKLARAERVGTAEFRAHLAKYLKLAGSGTPVVVQDRGRSAYVLTRVEDTGAPSLFGCMRERTTCAEGTVVNASEAWSPGEMP